MSWIIEDWAGNRLFGGMTFDSFEAGWGHVYAQVPADDIDAFDDYYIVPFD